jgi:formylglycine-generating enzyme required for sulfatase activity
MSRLFISHSSANNSEAVAIRDWLAREGWDEVFLDLDPARGIAAGERWERALNEAASRCEAVMFLISRAWLDSRWCFKEFNLARRLNKRLFGVLIEAIPLADLPEDLSGTWQVVDLASGHDHEMFRVVLPRTHEEAHVTFSREGLVRLHGGLARAGLEPRFFNWPPKDDPERPPYRGLRPLEAEDAGIFFGRDAPTVEALDRLRGLREAAAPRLLVILGASGSGKSSFLRAGILPRLARDDRDFLPLPVIRPEQAALTGDAGLVPALETALAAHGLTHRRADIRKAVAGGAEVVRPLLQQFAEKAFACMLAKEAAAPDPTIVIAIDQAEELFTADGLAEGEALLTLLRDLAAEDRPGIIVLFTIRSDSYDRLETAKPLEGLPQQTLPLLPMPRGAYQTVIEGPAERLATTTRRLRIEPQLTQRLLEDIEKGGGSDALPLLAFTLEQLYRDYGGLGALTAADYTAFGGIGGAIEAAVERALKAADADPRIPRNREARLALLRRGLIPWLAGIDPETGSPRRRIARRADIPPEAAPLVQLFVEQRLLVTDVVGGTDEHTIEPAHEALLRQWSLLRGWLADDTALLRIMEGVKSSAKDWAGQGKTSAWLTHTGSRLEAAEQLRTRPDLAANLTATDRNYLAACRKAVIATRRRRRSVQVLIYLLLLGIIGGLVGWIEQAAIRSEWRWYWIEQPFAAAKVLPYVLKPNDAAALRAGATFAECAPDQGKDYCPTMVVVPPGTFTMGSPSGESGRWDNEGPQHTVTIARPFAVAKFELTFDEWETCVTEGDCDEVSDTSWGRGSRPVINITWYDAQRYIGWLAKMTGKPYRMLTEAEYEYATRAGTQTAYPWGDEVGENNANCNGCVSKWGSSTVPVGSFPPNKLGLYDMNGNIWSWLQDCLHGDYAGAPSDGSEWTGGDCSSRVIRSGSWYVNPPSIRSAFRNWYPPDSRNQFTGLRLSRTLPAE